jgi:hypothetical protein
MHFTNIIDKNTAAAPAQRIIDKNTAAAPVNALH